MLDVAAILIERGYNVTLLSAGRYEPSSEYPGLNQITLGPPMRIKDLKNKPVIAWSSFLQFMEPVPYKNDPMFGSYTMAPLARQLNDARKQMNIKPVSGKMPKVSLALVDTFFGFELPQHLAPNVQEIGPVLSKEYPPLTPELSNFMNAHERVLYVAFVN
ncbi:unnamed protein product [Rhizophagus irregularis]|uniref:UDP-Glycosyltransferase/glycogen phosphorylase n=1 Tax=Rhizophagus irregularis TaxID=588596 RepID=A0A915YZE3_9GLOM|nr:unnamed protein product [Rhizophagus irregularis]CAB5353862.1 unnamed protein product [Rhizophagus irregularis]